MVVSFIMTTAVFKIMFGEVKKTKAPERSLPSLWHYNR